MYTIQYYTVYSGKDIITLSSHADYDEAVAECYIQYLSNPYNTTWQIVDEFGDVTYPNFEFEVDTEYDFSTLEGLVVNEIIKHPHNEDLIFVTNKGRFKMYHEQSCCEYVTLEDICGDLDDLINTPIINAIYTTNEKDHDSYHETWTFYTIRSIKGTVTLRWYGSSNGYYSETINFKFIGL